MIKSMTAFGRAKETIDNKVITVELKSVNSRYFDCSIKIPRLYGFLEDKIKSIELIDSLVTGPIYEYLKESGEEFKILIMPDHPTPLATKTHSSEPVPFLLVTDKDEIRFPGRCFSEKEAEKTGIYEEFAHKFTDSILR